jgi:hypothetical protein
MIWGILFGLASLFAAGLHIPRAGRFYGGRGIGGRLLLCQLPGLWHNALRTGMPDHRDRNGITVGHHGGRFLGFFEVGVQNNPRGAFGSGTGKIVRLRVVPGSAST